MNEEEIKIKVVLPLLSELGFDHSDLHFEEYTRPWVKEDKRSFADIVAFKGDTPVILVEVKASTVNLRGTQRSAAVKQAVAYARRRHQIVPFALVTNGLDLLLVDVISGKEAIGAKWLDGKPTDPLNKMARVIRGALERIQETRLRAMASLGFPDRSRLLKACQQQRRGEIGSISGVTDQNTPIIDRKFIPALYVKRLTAELGIKSFLRDEWPVLAVIGDAGMGKTNLIYAFAERYGATNPTVLYNAPDLNGSLLEAIAEDLAMPFPDASGFAQRMTEVLDTDSRFLVCLDALNETTAQREKLRAELNLLARRFGGTSCRLLVTCRSLDWQYWSRSSSGALSPIGRAINPNFTSRRTSDRGLVLERLSVQEFHAAWLLYKKMYHLKGRLSDRMEEMCREPFMLRLLAEVYKNGDPIPNYVEPIELFRRYIDEKFPLATERRNVSRALWVIAKTILETAEPRVPYAAMPGEYVPAIEALLDENVVIYRAGGALGFTFELFLEYVVSDFVRAAVGEDVHAKVRKVEEIRKSGLLNGPGVVENLLLNWQSDPEALISIGRRMIKWEDQWKAILTSALRKSTQPVKEWAELVQALAADSNHVIRLYTAQSLKNFVEINDWGLIDSMAQSSSWELREVAASAGGFLGANETASIGRIFVLAADYHWRVRRAAGYSLRQLLVDPLARELAEQDLKNNFGHVDWRSKYAFVIALSGLHLDSDSPAANFLWQLSTDAHPQVRWAVAHYVPRVSGTHAAQLLVSLAEDPDPWVRKEVASSAVEFLAIAPREALAMVETFVGDSNIGVRVQLARDLALTDKKELACQWLELLLAGGDDASFAAAFTLRGLSLRDSPLATELLHGTPGAHELAVRERIARRDMELLHSPFTALGDYIARRTEYSDRGDSYMDVVDTMCSLIRDSTEVIANSGVSTDRLIAELARDSDEGVRWALVLFLTEYRANATEGETLQRTLQGLLADEHWWVRREVALVLRKLRDVDHQGAWAAELFGELIARERALGLPGSDEVLFFALV